jgi:hypothetical protein
LATVLSAEVEMRNVANMVRESSTTTGTGDFTLAAVTGWRRFSDAFGTGASALFLYAIRHESVIEDEAGFGYCSDADTLVRVSILGSSNGGAAVDFSAGDKDVRCGPSVEWVGMHIDRPKPGDLGYDVVFDRDGATTHRPGGHGRIRVRRPTWSRTGRA